MSLERGCMHLDPAPTGGWPTERGAAFRKVEPHTERQVCNVTFSLDMISGVTMCPVSGLRLPPERQLFESSAKSPTESSPHSFRQINKWQFLSTFIHFDLTKITLVSKSCLFKINLWLGVIKLYWCWFPVALHLNVTSHNYRSPSVYI